MSFKNYLPTILLLVIIIAVALAGGYIFGLSQNPPTTATPRPTTGVLDSAREVWDIIHQEYVDRDNLDSEALEQGAIEGMLETLDDPYTAYLDPEAFNFSLIDLEGEFEGIGAYVSVDENDNIVIVTPIVDSPAEKAGVRPGDIILGVDGESTEGLSLIETIIKVRGPRGTTVKLLVLHEGETEPVEIEITRDTIEVSSVRFEMVEDIAYITITQFHDRTADELAPVIREAEDAGATGIVLDLRGNPGGLLNVVVEVTSHFINEGTVISVRDNEGEITDYQAISGRRTTDLPMVVLVNHGSASGSEVVAGALQDSHRAVIAGETTFGKGSVNEFQSLSDGSGIYITVARWLTPNGRLIEGQGIEPDIPLELTGEEAVQWAVDYLHAN